MHCRDEVFIEASEVPLRDFSGELIGFFGGIIRVELDQSPDDWNIADASGSVTSPDGETSEPFGDELLPALRQSLVAHFGGAVEFSQEVFERSDYEPETSARQKRLRKLFFRYPRGK